MNVPATTASRTVVSGGQLVELARSQPSFVSGSRYYPSAPGEVPSLDSPTGRWVDPEVAYQRQPNLRMVVDYIASRGSTVPLSAYRLVDAEEREKLRDDTVIGRTLGEPYPGLGQTRFLYELLVDCLLWDRWAFVIGQDAAGRTSWIRLPPRWWHFGEGLTGQRAVLIDALGNAAIPATSVCADGGRDGGTPQVATLADSLYELTEANSYRNQLYTRGARVPQVIQRPADAPEWSDAAKEKFRTSWQNAWAGDGPEAGGTPILEDGMQLAKADAFSPVDLQFIEGRQASLIELCNFYHAAPELLGARPGTYSNIQAFRVGLYQETLGPVLQPFEEAITLQAARPMMGDDLAVYCEFNVEAMMRGTFEEQAQVLQSAVGAPYLLRDEARALFNRPPLPDGQGEEIVTPLNVLVGGLASPRDTAPKARRHVAGQKARGSQPVAVATERLASTYRGWVQMIRRDVLPQLAEPAPIPEQAKGIPRYSYDQDALAADLARRIRPHTTTAARHGAHQMVDRYGGKAEREAWKDEQLDAWLVAQANRQGLGSAVSLKNELDAALVADDSQAAARGIFAAAIGRAALVARDLTGGAFHLGQSDGAKATGVRTKTWVVTSDAPRESHAALDGETVGAGDVFSNGGRWPGDSALPVEETAGCTCELEWG